MKGKLIPGSTSITQMLCAQAFCCRTLHKWSRFSFSIPKQAPYENNSYLGFQVFTWQHFDLHVARSVKTTATPVEEDVFLELKKLLNNGLLKKKDVDKALVNRNSYADLNNSLLVLQCISKLPDISPEKRVMLSEKFLSKVKSINGVVTENHCLQVLECYLKSKCFKNLDSFLSTMKNYGVDHSKEVQLSVFKCLSVKGLAKEDSALAKELENSDLKDSEELNAIKIYNLAVSGSINEAFEEIKQMKKNNGKIGSKIYTSLLKAVALKGDKHCIGDLAKDACMEGIIFSHDQILDILENIAISEQYNLISDVKMLCVDEVLLKASQILLVKLLHSDKIESAYNFMNYLFSLNFICGTGDEELLFNAMCKSFIEESCKINCSVDNLIQKCRKLKKLKKCLHSLEYALYCCLKKGDISGSLAILHGMFNDGVLLEPHYFWPLLITFKEKFGDEGIIFVLDKTVELKVPLNAETFTDYIFPNISYLQFAKDIMERVFFNEAQQELFIEAFVLYTIKNRLFKEGLQFTSEYPLRRDTTYAFLKEHLTEALLENPHCKELVMLAKEANAVDPFSIISKLWSRGDKLGISQLSEYFKKHKMYTDNVEEAKVFVKLNKGQPLICEAVSKILNNDPSKAETIKIKKSCRFDELVQLEEAEVILAELKAKNMNTTGQRLRLVKMYLRNQFHEKAVKAKKEVLQLLGDNPDFSPAYCTIFARLSAHENDPENSIRYLNIVKEKYPYFRVGCITGLSICANFIRNNRFKEMLNVLQALPKWEGKAESISARAVHLLREVARLGMPELTDVVFKIMQRKKYIEVDVNSLQVFTASYLHVNDMDGAVKEYYRVAEEHDIVCNTTPMLWSVVQANRLDLVDKIIDLCTRRVRNKTHLLSTLTIIACKGDIELLMNYSKKLKFPLNDDFMITKFVDGKAPCCPTIAYKTLIKAAKINRLSYDHFLSGAVRSILKKKDFEGATDFLNFCKSNEIELNQHLSAKLEIQSELGKIAAASAFEQEKEKTKIYEEIPTLPEE